MRQVYDALADSKELAYSKDALAQLILGQASASDHPAVWIKYQSDTVVLARTLEALIRIGAIENRQVDQKDYYAFSQEHHTTASIPALGRT